MASMGLGHPGDYKLWSFDPWLLGVIEFSAPITKVGCPVQAQFLNGRNGLTLLEGWERFRRGGAG